MVLLEQFAVERWMDDHENDAKYNLAETCSDSISLNDLFELANKKDVAQIFDLSRKLLYGAIRGSTALRSNLATCYPLSSGGNLSPENIIVTAGAIQANFLAIYTLIGPGDHVICQYPTYQQLYSVPKSLGSEVSLWKSDPNQGWALNLDELERLIKPNTKLIIINNPQNPTGAILMRHQLQRIVDIARAHGIYILSDEVYRPLFHGDQLSEIPPSLLYFDYEKTIAIGSMSKAYSLAGIRLGWIAARDRNLIEMFASTRDYTTISVSQIDDQIATAATAPGTVENLLQRNTELARKNLAILEAFINDHSETCDWIKPQAGTTAFVQFRRQRDGKLIDDVIFCEALQKKAGVMFVPGSRCFGNNTDFQGYIRIGYVCEHDILVQGLEALREFMKSDFDKVLVMSEQH